MERSAGARAAWRREPLRSAGRSLAPERRCPCVSSASRENHPCLSVRRQRPEQQQPRPGRPRLRRGRGHFADLWC